MEYYNYKEDVFFDDKGYLIPDVRDICNWYLIDNRKYQSFKYTKQSSNGCKIIYNSLLAYSRTGKIEYSRFSIPNFLIRVMDHKLFKNSSYNCIYKPYVDKGIGCYINLLTQDGTLMETVITNKKYTYSVDSINYFRVLLSLKYYLLGIRSDYGYLVHCSFKSAVRVIEIDHLLNHEQCENIINNYLKANTVQRKADINKLNIDIYNSVNNYNNCLLLDYSN